MADSDYAENYTAYCRAHGLSPSEMMARDVQLYPGGCMCGFILWISKKKREFGSEFPQKVSGIGTIIDHRAFSDFLKRGDAIEVNEPARIAGPVSRVLGAIRIGRRGRDSQ